jgi:signal transduction histidine kinase
VTAQLHQRTTEPGVENQGGPREEALATALRGVALHAAEQLGGGIGLVFTTAAKGDTTPRLRAAAGFASLDAARAAAVALQTSVSAVMQTGVPRHLEFQTAVGPIAAGYAIVVPLRSDSGCLGALAAAGTASPAPAALEALSLLAALAASRLEQGALVGELSVLRARVEELEKKKNDGNDELLQLSETVFAQDIEILQNREAIGKIERLKNDFIEKMSRELRTPLNSIIESVISVLANENESLSESAKNALRHALDEGTAFLRTLQNILDLWRIRQGELPIEIHEVSFRDVVEESIFSVQDTLGDKPVTIEKNLREPLPKIRTDLAKLSQILFLLLDNAAKFTPKGRIEIRAELRDGALRCELEDTGIGICHDDQQYVFDEFYQVDASTSSRYRGAGLGLTLVKELLALLGGQLSLVSEVGKGTTVSFELPVQPLA